MRTAVGLVLVLLVSLPSHAGGAWLVPPGKVDLQLGVSRKTASSSWDSSGNAFDNTTTFEGHTVPHYHDFRYVYLSGEVGLHDRVSAQFLVTWLHGLEGPHAELERNVGWSDAWVGLKTKLTGGAWPMALGMTMRTPALYDRSGPYSRYITDAGGNRLGVSSEWRGVLKHDYSLTYLLSHSFDEGRGWMNFETGYTWREGAPSDHVPLSLEVGVPWRRVAVKASVAGAISMSNDTLAAPDDRFRSRPTFNFNDATMWRAGVAVIVPVRNIDLEAGYNQWLRGESARRYREPYVSVGYRF
jgi:hypothetical protein